MWTPSTGKAHTPSGIVASRAPLYTSNFFTHGPAFFSDGVRAPPWRRVHGDLGYVVIKPRESDVFYAVANVNGFWQVKVGEQQYVVQCTSDSDDRCRGPTQPEAWTQTS